MGVPRDLDSRALPLPCRGARHVPCLGLKRGSGSPTHSRHYLAVLTVRCRTQVMGRGPEEGLGEQIPGHANPPLQVPRAPAAPNCSPPPARIGPCVTTQRGSFQQAPWTRAGIPGVGGRGQEGACLGHSPPLLCRLLSSAGPHSSRTPQSDQWAASQGMGVPQALCPGEPPMDPHEGHCGNRRVCHAPGRTPRARRPWMAVAGA